MIENNEILLIEEEIEALYLEFGDEPNMPKEALIELDELRKKLERLQDEASKTES